MTNKYPFTEEQIKQVFDTRIYMIEDIKEILYKQTNRFAKMLMKIGKRSTGQLFLLINLFLQIVDSSDEDKFDDILERSMKMV